MSQTPTPEQPGEQVKPHRGAVILVFGILGILVCFIFGIAAWVMGNADLAEMEAGRMDRQGEGLTKAGKICGIIGIALQGIVILIQLLLIVLGIGAAAAGAGAGAGG